MAKVTICKLTAISSLLLFSSQVFSGDDPVNCRNETFEHPVYGGSASCTTSSGARISSFVSHSGTPTTRLSDFVKDDNGVSRLEGCFASVPFSHTRTETREVCDYTPDADFRVPIVYDGEAITASITATASGSSLASDRDGSIVQRSWALNGVSYGSSIPSITVGSFTRLTFKHTVTDDDGYTDSKTKVVYVDPGDAPDPCDGEIGSCVPE